MTIVTKLFSRKVKQAPGSLQTLNIPTIVLMTNSFHKESIQVIYGYLKCARPTSSECIQLNTTVLLSLFSAVMRCVSEKHAGKQPLLLQLNCSSHICSLKNISHHCNSKRMTRAASCETVTHLEKCFVLQL